MAKQQTLTIVVPDHSPDPADLIEGYLNHVWATWTEEEIAKYPELFRDMVQYPDSLGDQSREDFMIILEEA